MDDHDLERRLRRFTPEAPPAHLRSRVLRAAGTDEDRPPGLLRSWRWPVLTLLVAGLMGLWFFNQIFNQGRSQPASGM